MDAARSAWPSLESWTAKTRRHASKLTLPSSETKEGIQELHTLVERQVHTKIKRMRMDRGSDYTSQELKDWANDVGVVFEQPSRVM